MNSTICVAIQSLLIRLFYNIRSANFSIGGFLRYEKIRFFILNTFFSLKEILNSTGIVSTLINFRIEKRTCPSFIFGDLQDHIAAEAKKGADSVQRPFLTASLRLT